MFNALLFAASADRCAYLKALALEAGNLLLIRPLDYLPLGYDLIRTLNAEPELVLLDMRDWDEAVGCAASIREHDPGLPIIGFAAAEEGDAPSPLTLVLPFGADAPALRQAVDDAVHLARPELQTNLLAFLPSKAGSGASTAILNTAAALANEFSKKVLVLEADLRSGALSIMLNRQPEHYLQSVLAASGELDALRLRSCVMTAHGVDWLLTSRDPARGRAEWHDYYRLLAQAGALYDFVLADLPELVNPATREIVRSARPVFIVCTPELIPLRLAGHRCQELEKWGVPQERIMLVVNRWLKTKIEPKDIESLLGRSVYHVLANDYAAVQASVMKGGPVDSHALLWRQFAGLAAKLAGDSSGRKPSPLSKVSGIFRNWWPG